MNQIFVFVMYLLDTKTTPRYWDKFKIPDTDIFNSYWITVKQYDKYTKRKEPVIIEIPNE